jgi:hypothetical protein
MPADNGTVLKAFSSVKNVIDVIIIIDYIIL